MKTFPIISGFPDEVSDALHMQIKTIKTLGWSFIDLRTVDGKNVSCLSNREFDETYQQLSDNNIKISCFGSTIANWSRSAFTDFELDMVEMKNSIRHMKKAGVTFIRIMSYKIDQPIPLDSDLEDSIISNIRKIVRLAEDNNIICLHENCETWGGQSSSHSLRLLERVDSPALKLVFDTGNPVSMKDISGSPPYNYQDPLRFFKEVQEHVAYLHIKDANRVNETLQYTFPGKGAGRVKNILEHIRRNNLEIPIAIEPHVSMVFHDPSIKVPFEERWKNFIDYGNQLVTMAEEAGISFST